MDINTSTWVAAGLHTPKVTSKVIPDGPTIIPLDFLAPDPALKARMHDSAFFLQEFTNGCEYPPELEVLLHKHGYRFDDCGGGMLFASTVGVPLHQDDQWSVLWVLECPPSDCQQLIVGNQHLFLQPGMVLLFDALAQHGVISHSSEFWGVYSAYVAKLDD